MITSKDMAKMLSVTSQTLRNWIVRGFIAKDCYIYVGTTLRFDPTKTIESLRDSRMGNAPEQFDFFTKEEEL